MKAPAVLLSASVALAASAAGAHPHVWVVAQPAYRIESGRVVAVELALRFDELLSASLVADYDRDRNGVFDPAETARLERETFAGLAELDWLSRLRVDGRPVPLHPPSGFVAEFDGGLVTYRFVRRLVAPVDPRSAAVALTVVDPSWYVDVMLDPEAPARLLGEAPAGCELGFEPDTSLANLVAPMPPIAATLLCPRRS